MQRGARNIVVFIIINMLLFLRLAAQISPGALSSPHSHLEGISNCTQCHELGNKVSDNKCLACHTEITEQDKYPERLSFIS